MIDMKIILKYTIFIVCLSVLFSIKASAQDIALKTNVLMLGGLTPNLGCEIVTGEHTSVDFSAFGHKNPYGLTSKVIGFQPEFRYWFNGRPMIREYIGIGALLLNYDFTSRQKLMDGDAMKVAHQVNDGDAVGLGITGGYVFYLSPRLNIELSGSFGMLFFRQKQYYVQDNYDDYFVTEPQRANSFGYRFFPVDLGVTFAWIIK